MAELDDGSTSPQISHFDTRSIDISTVAPIFCAPIPGDEVDYLDYDIKGRALHEKLFFNSGMSFLGGSVIGTLYGGVTGLRNATSSRSKVRMNALLNGASKFGSRFGNGMGVIAFYYTTIEKLVDMAQVEETLGIEHTTGIISPVLSGCCTGMLYKCTNSRPATILVAGAIGGAISGASYFSDYLMDRLRY